MSYSEYINELITELKIRALTKKQITNLKMSLCSKYKIKKMPTDIEILLNAKEKDIPKIKRYLLTKPTRTISGVAVAAVMTKPFPCPHVKSGIGPCIMCPGGPDSFFGSVPQSYTGKEPATRRAIRNNYDPYLQVMNRLEQYIALGQDISKVELIIMGGTFPSFPKKYQEEFVKYSLKAMNDFSKLFFNKNKFDIMKFKKFFELPSDINNEDRIKRIHTKLLSIKNKNKKQSLESVQKENEKSNVRCVALCIETRPDYAMLKEGNEMLRLGCTRIELGVQTVYDDVLKKIKRGHTVEDSIAATEILKDLGFKVSYHMMPGLPGVDRERDLFSLNAIFAYSEFRPDMLKIYPCMVLQGTKLYEDYKKGKFKPITTKEAIKLLAEFKKNIPPWVRISRLQRDIPTIMTEDGVDMTNLRQEVQKKLAEKKVKCRCIRCREAGHMLNQNPKLKIGKIVIHAQSYAASEGSEFFISAEDVKNKILFGFCRLRFPAKSLRKEITDETAIVRELHVFGAATAFGKVGLVQHKGIGKNLLKEAETIAKTYYKNKIVVISGIGAREYYRKLGYNREGPYMVKRI